MAYPELVSRGVSKSCKFKWLVKVGACKDVNPLIKKNHGRGGFPGNQKTPLDTPLILGGFRWIHNERYLDMNSLMDEIDVRCII